MDRRREDKQSRQFISLLEVSLPARGWEEKMCNFCRFSLRNSFAILKVRTVMSKRMDKRSHAWSKLIFAVSLFLSVHLPFAAAHCFRSLPGQLTPII